MERNCTVHDLRRCILRVLDEYVLMTPEKDRTELQGMLLQTGRAFTDSLIQLERGGKSERRSPAGRNFASVARAYNEINRQTALRNQDAEALAIFRDPLGDEED